MRKKDQKIALNGEDQAWIDYQRIYSEVYDDSNYLSPLQSSAMHASHKLAEKPYGQETHFPNTLEIGAGTGEHFPFVRHGYDQYYLTDIDIKPLNVARNKLAPLIDERVIFERQAGDHLNYPDGMFDRVVAVHVLEHIYKPHMAIKEWSRVLRDGGTLTILLPTDPGLAWRLGRHFGPRKNALKIGIDYDYVMAREHVNSCNNLVALLRHYFPDQIEAWWPLRVSSIDLNLFVAFHVKVLKSKVMQ